VLAALADLMMPDSPDLIMMPAADELMMPDTVELTVLAGVAAGVVIMLQHLHKHLYELPKPAPAEVPLPAAAVLMQLFHSQVTAEILRDWWQLSSLKMMLHLQ
jgi:hypothetical protein